jgi:hypothetical protein
MIYLWHLLTKGYMMGNPQSESLLSNETNRVKNALVLIISSEGVSILDNPKKTRALLLDYCFGNNKREIILLEQLLNEQIHTELVRLKNAVPYSIHSVNLMNKILETHPFDETLARWGIDTLAITLGIIQSAPCSTQRPAVQPAAHIIKDSPTRPVTIKETAKIYDVTFYSEPPGAEIFINGKSHGFSPLSIPLGNGTYCVSGSLPDYDNWKRDISIPYELFVRIELKKKMKVKPKRSMTPYFNRLPKSPTPENQGILGRIKDKFK